MKDGKHIFLTFSGAGGGKVDSGMFAAPSPDMLFLPVELPRWQWFLSADRAPADLLTYLQKQIDHLVPVGPVSFAGVSLGGHLAYAMALQCAAQGRTVESLCLVDCFFGRPPVAGGRRLKRGLLKALATNQLHKWVFERCIRRGVPFWQRHRIQAWKKHAIKNSQPWDLRSGSATEHELSMRLLSSLARPFSSIQDKKPEEVMVPALLLRTLDNASQDRLWRERCLMLDIMDLPGDHHSISEPATISVIHAGFATWLSDEKF